MGKLEQPKLKEAKTADIGTIKKTWSNIFLKLKVKTWLIITGAILSCIFFTLFHYVVPNVANRIQISWSESIGVKTESDGWFVDLSDAKIYSPQVRVFDDFSTEPIVETGKVALNFSGWKLFLSLFGFGDWRLSITELTIEQPRVLIQKNELGKWNLQTLSDSDYWSQLTVDQLSGEKSQPDIQTALYNPKNDAYNTYNASLQKEVSFIWFRRINIYDMKIDWEQELPVVTENGAKITWRTELNVDDVNISLSNIAWPPVNLAGHQQIDMRGRMGDGQITASLQSNMFNWQVADAGKFSLASHELQWQPTVTGVVNLNNVAADKFWRVIPDPVVHVQPDGRVSGDIKFRLDNRYLLAVESELTMNNVLYSINTSATKKGKGARTLYRSAETAATEFDGDLRNKGFDPVPFIITNTVEDSLRDSDQEVQAITAAQTAKYSQGLSDDAQAKAQQKRSPAVQNMIALALGAAIASKLDDKVGSTGAAAIGVGVAAFTSNVMSYFSEQSGQTKSVAKRAPNKPVAKLPQPKQVTQQKETIQETRVPDRADSAFNRATRKISEAFKNAEPIRENIVVEGD